LYPIFYCAALTCCDALPPLSAAKHASAAAILAIASALKLALKRAHFNVFDLQKPLASVWDLRLVYR